MGTTRLADEMQAPRSAGRRAGAGGSLLRGCRGPVSPHGDRVAFVAHFGQRAQCSSRCSAAARSSAAGDANDLALYIGVAEALLDASKDTALLLSLDSLQWADRATLDLLAHVVGALAQAANDGTVPACVLLTVGDVDADAAAARDAPPNRA